MNNLLLKFINLGKSFKNFFKINPHKHWKFLLYIFLVMTSLLILSSIFFLFQIRNNKIFQVKLDQIEKKTFLNDDLLKKTINLYENKAKAEEEIVNNIFPHNDPSF